MIVARRLAVTWALLSVFLFAGWECLTVQRNFGGNWTALFCTGDALLMPPSLASGTYVFRKSNGYDGQMYRYVAHDPFLRGETNAFLDDPILRTRRILVPGLAWMFAFGRQSLIDYTYIGTLWMFVFLGCYWTGLWAQSVGGLPTWAAGFLLLPATLISMDRMTVDVATCALTAGLLWYWFANDDRKLYVVLAMVCLSRETGLIIAAAFVGSALLHRQRRRAIVFATAAIPTAAWYWFVHRHATGAANVGGVPEWFASSLQFGPLIRMLHPVAYDLPPGLAKFAQTLDSLALASMIFGFFLAVVYWLRQRRSAPNLAALLFALSFFAVSAPLFWDTVYGYARPFSPMLLLVALAAAADIRRLWFWLLPCAFLDLRIFLQLGPRVLGLSRAPYP